MSVFGKKIVLSTQRKPQLSFQLMIVFSLNEAPSWQQSYFHLQALRKCRISGVRLLEVGMGSMERDVVDVTNFGDSHRLKS
jgi:hypothetical protein